MKKRSAAAKRKPRTEKEGLRSQAAERADFERIKPKKGDPAHESFIQHVLEVDGYQEAMLLPVLERARDNWKVYYGDRLDERLEHEKKWRALLTPSHVWSAIQTITANLIEIINSADPPIQAEGVGDEDRETAAATERELAWMLRMMRWTRIQAVEYPSLLIQGYTVPKICWIEREHTMEIPVAGARAYTEFRKYVRDAEMASKTKMPDDLADFEQWRKEINTAFPHLRVPNIPNRSGRERVVRYRGPQLQHTNLVDISFDPLTFDFQDQTQVRHRMVKSRRWIDEQVKAGYWDKEQVEESLAATDTEKLRGVQAEIVKLAGVGATGQTSTDPDMRDGHEVLEIYRPEDEKWRYACVLNRVGVVNKKPWQMPNGHGYIPFGFLAARQLHGLGIGEPEVTQVKKVHDEMTLHRELLLDNATLKAIGVYSRLVDSGVKESDLKIFPGLVMDTIKAGGVQKVNTDDIDIAAGLAIWNFLKAEIDEALGTGANLRGAASTVGRVSATAEQGRLDQTITRVKHRALFVEEDWSRAIPQLLGLMAEYALPEDRENIGGFDPLRGMTMTQLLRSLSMDFRFVGATQATNREQQAQLEMGLLRTSGKDTTVIERRELLRRIASNLGAKGIDKLYTKDGDRILQAIESAMQRAILQPPAPPTAPIKVGDPRTLDAMNAEAVSPQDEAGLEAQAAAEAAGAAQE